MLTLKLCLLLLPTPFDSCAMASVPYPDPTDPASLLSLIQSSIDHSELADARAWLELFLSAYPTAGPQYLVYVELELAHDNFPEVERLFERAFSREPSGKAGKGKARGGGPCFPLGYPPLWSMFRHFAVCNTLID